MRLGKSFPYIVSIRRKGAFDSTRSGNKKRQTTVFRNHQNAERQSRPNRTLISAGTSFHKCILPDLDTGTMKQFYLRGNRREWGDNENFPVHNGFNFRHLQNGIGGNFS